MSVAVQDQNHWQSWLEQAGIAELWPWQEHVLKSVVCNASTLAFLPRGGGKGLCSLLTGATQPGKTLLICGNTERTQRRIEQAYELGMGALLWDGIASTTKEQSYIQILEEPESFEELVELSKAWDVFSRIIWEHPRSRSEIPSFWSNLKQPRVLFAASTPSSSEDWWLTPSHQDAYTVLNFEQSEHSAWNAPSIQDTSKVVTDWLEEQPQPDASVWFMVDTHELPNDAPSEHWDRIPSSGQARAEHTRRSPSAHIVLSPEDSVPHTAFTPEYAVFAKPPTHLQQLCSVARRCNQALVFRSQDAANTASNLNTDVEQEKLQEYLNEVASASLTRHVYTSLSELMSVVGMPLAPQPKFERGIATMQNKLKQMQQKGFLLEVEEVAFQVKIHSVQQFTEKNISKTPELLAFWNAYQNMQSTLSPFDALKLSFMNGRSLDLRQLAQHMDYNVAELNAIIRSLQEKNWILADLEHTSSHQRLDQELQLRVGQPHNVSLAVQLWLASQEYRRPLLQSMLNYNPLSYEQLTAFQTMVSSQPKEDAFWNACSTLITEETNLNDVFDLAAHVLASLEAGENPANLILWECCSAHLKLPGLDIRGLRQALCHPKHASNQIKPYLHWWRKARENNQKVARYYLNYSLDLSDITGFEEEAIHFLNAERENILTFNTAHRVRSLLQRYIRLSAHWQEQHENEQAAWSLSTAWALFVLGSTQKAWNACSHIQAGEHVQCSEVEQIRWAQIAVKARQTGHAIDILHPVPDSDLVSPEVLEELRQELFNQIANQCKQTAQKNTGRKVKGHPILSPIDWSERSTEWIRGLLSDLSERTSRDIQPIALRYLAERGDATVDELRQLAGSSQREGEHTYARSLREQILEREPKDLHNVMQLAQLAIKQKDIPQALEWALLANRSDPQQFPMEGFIRRHKEACFTDLKQLRELLIELPAHPAFTSLEEELEAQEELERTLRPQHKKLQALLEENKFGQARAQLQEIFQKYKKQTPPEFAKIKSTIDFKIKELRQRLSKFPKRDARKRNKHFEEVAAEARQMGLEDIEQDAYQKLLRFNPQYGLGHLKFARTAATPAQRKAAYRKAFELSRTPEQKVKNLEEFVDYLEDTKDFSSLLDLLLEIAADEPTRAARRIEPYLLRLAQKASGDEVIVEKIEAFLEQVEKPQEFKRVKQALQKMDKLEPWKRALLSIQSK